MKYTNESGRSMVEMLGVLAIIGVLSVGGIAGYSKAMNKYKINKTTDQVSMLVANLRTLFSTQGNYDGLDNAAAVNFGVVPEDMVTKSGTSTTLKNAFNGAVTITEAAARSSGEASGVGEAFNIEYAGLSDEACVTVVTGDWGSGQASGLIGIAAGKAASATSGTLTAVGTAVNGIFVDDATACEAGANLVVAAPGGTNTTGTGDDAVTVSVPTPVSVTNAVDACTGGGSGNAVAWKYY